MWIISHLLTVFGFALCVLLIVRLLHAHRPPGTTIAWLLAIMLIPYAGVPAYLLFGGRKLKRMAGRKRTLFGVAGQEPPAGNTSPCTTERVLTSAGMPPAQNGNSVELLGDGVTGYRALVSLLEEARESIHIMTFILGRDETGRAIVELLARRASEGVEVRLLLDALGCLRTRGRFVDPIRRSGGKVGVFMPVLPLRRKWSANLRNHRKITVIDGRTAMIGGMNIAGEYMGPAADADRWLDAVVLVRGPAVADLHAIFADDWYFASNETLDPCSSRLAAESGRQNGSLVQVAASGPDTVDDALYEAIFTATVEAGQRIWLVTPYFVPDEPLLKTLLLQSRLGRDVRLIVPRRSNHVIADLARAEPLRSLAAAGARVFLCEKMIHAKLGVFDDELAVIGSANVDERSFYLNYEAQLFIYSAGDVAAISQWIRQCMAESAELEITKVSAIRGWAEDLSELVAPLL